MASPPSQRGFAPSASPPAMIRSKTSVRGYLPMTDESVFTTRGQTLPQLLSQLGTSLVTNPGLSRRGSYFVAPEDRDLEVGPEERLHGREDVDLGGRRSLLAEVENASWNTGLETQGLWPHGKPAEDRRLSDAAKALMTPQMRSMRLIGNSNPRYKWERYYKSDEELKKMKKPIREYYERNNSLIQQYVYIDKLLDSSLPHNLIQEYNQQPHSAGGASPMEIPMTIPEERGGGSGSGSGSSLVNRVTSFDGTNSNGTNTQQGTKLKRTPKNLYKLPDENTPLMSTENDEAEDGAQDIMPAWTPDEESDSGDRIILATILTSSVSVLAALVDAVLDFLSTAIVWTTTRLISTDDQYKYPAGRRKLEPIGVLVFSVIMITSFFQVGLEGFNRLTDGDHVPVNLGFAAVIIMASTVLVKGACWVWCRLIKNSSVQALAQDAATDVVFNIFSIIFPLVGYYADIWYLDPLGGILLSLYVIYAWSTTTAVHIRNLSGAAATADERNVLLYLTMRFAKTIKQIQGLQAYHAGDKLNVEVDIVVDENMRLRDSHDLGESLQYVLESVPTVDRAFVHLGLRGSEIYQLI